MYQIRCDDNILYDPRDEDLVLRSPRCSLGSNKVGSASFTILPTHPHFRKLQKLKSIISIKQDNRVIFRGRVTGDTQDINNNYAVDVEGVLGYTNDTLIPPFRFPNDFPEAETAENMVEYFLGWVLDQHNALVQPWQKLKLGRVTVADKNNVITRESTAYTSTWDILKTKLFESSLGGYLYVRHEDDGDYVDYVDKFELTNTQRIVFGENMTNITKDSNATQTYTAIYPQGKDGLTIKDLPDGKLTEDLVKDGIYIYSKSSVEQYGWICVPVNDSKWGDVTLADNLQDKAMEKMTADSMRLSSTISFQAVDLHYSDGQIQSFQPYRKVLVDAPVHGIVGADYDLTSIDLDLLNPQYTMITVGTTIRTLNDINVKNHSDTIQRVQTAERDISENRTEVSNVKDQMLIQSTQVINDCEKIILSALESYVESSNLEEFKQTVEAQMKVMADQISMNFTQTNSQITNVNGDLQQLVETINKHFDFGIDGLTIRAGENTMQLTLDNDIIIFKKNGQQFGWWDGVNFHTGNIFVDVDEIAQFGNYGFVPYQDDETDGLDLVRVGG